MMYIRFNLIGNVRDYCIFPVRRKNIFSSEEELYPSLPLGFRCFLLFLFFYLLRKCRTFIYLHNRQMRKSSITMQSINLLPFFSISKELAFYRKTIPLYGCIAFCHQSKAGSLSPILTIPLILRLRLLFSSKKLL